jgi:hypothetical protein
MLEIPLPRDWTLSFAPLDANAEEQVAELKFLGDVMCRLHLGRSMLEKRPQRVLLLEEAERWIERHEISRLHDRACTCSLHRSGVRQLSVGRRPLNASPAESLKAARLQQQHQA